MPPPSESECDAADAADATDAADGEGERERFEAGELAAELDRVGEFASESELCFSSCRYNA